MFLSRFFFTFLIFCFNLIFSSEYPYRDITKPPFLLPDDVRIIQSSPMRTGSTLIYNILQYLFEDTLGNHALGQKKVSKSHTHVFILENEYIVSTIRNPLDALASIMCVREKSDDNNVLMIDKKTLDRYAKLSIRRYLNFINLHSSSSERLLVLKYEEFINNYEYIYTNLEAFFNITIDPETRELMSEFFSIEAMKALSSEYKSFTQYHPIIGIHGNHINEVEWRKNIPEEFHEYLIDKFQDILNLYNYNP